MEPVWLLRLLQGITFMSIVLAILAFVFSTVIAGFMILMVAAVCAAATAVLLAGIGWTIEWGVVLTKVRRSEDHVRRRFFEARKGYDHWWKKCFFATWIVWTLVGAAMFIQSKEDMLLDVKHWMTFGYTEPGKVTRVEEPIVVVKTEIRRYRLVSYNPPKHFYVTIKDLQTNQTYESLYVSKHCNNHATNKLGDDYNIQITHKRQGQKEWIVFNDLYAVFCGG